ncbi:MAG: prephenate dehydrogenase/arogenate dehydrogenase family protein [bacterium]|nr:prephenate dehydrogenase/arogenate dehydrogenase family protein [bacterium]
MANTIQVGILGLGRVGASFGMALKRYNAGKGAAQQFQVTAFDTSESRTASAKRKGAFDAQARHLADAARDKDLIILAMPYAETQAVYRELGGAVRPGSVILDLSPYKLPSSEWAVKHLKPDVFMVGAAAILNPAYLFDGLDDTDHAAADLFDKGALLIMPTVQAEPAAVELVSDLAALIGTTPRFADPIEYDGWAAATEGLPLALGVAAFYSLTRAGTWRDVQRQGNPNFGRLIHHLYDTHPDDLRDLLLNNRAALIRQIDQMQEALGALRDLLAKPDRDGLEALLGKTTDDAVLWVVNRRDDRWEPNDAPKIDTGSIATNLFLGGALGKRLRGDKENGKN